MRLSDEMRSIGSGTLLADYAVRVAALEAMLREWLRWQECKRKVMPVKETRALLGDKPA